MESEAQRRASRPLSTSEQLALVERLAERLADCRAVDDVGTVITSTVKGAINASAMVLGVTDDELRTLVALRSEGLAATTDPLVSRPVLLDETMPAYAVLQRREPLFWSSLAERERAFPGLAEYPSEHQSWAILPLVARQQALGILVFGWREPGRFRRSDAALLSAIAHQSALAIDRCRLDAARRAERETLELLSEGTRLMVSALDPERVLASLVRLAVPRLAPWCAVYVAEGGEGGELRRVAIEIGSDAELASQLRSAAAAVRADAEVPLAIAYRTGAVQVVPVVTEEIVRRVYGEPLMARVMAAQGAPHQLTSVNVPIRAGGQVIGVMSLVSGLWQGNPSSEVLFAAEGLAGRAGVALANARRFEHERETAALLTKALVPASAPAIPGYEIVAKYLPAGSRVAGDWFDVARLPSGSYLVGVGDAGGHGIHAASLMAQLRNGARALAFAGHPPAHVLGFLAAMTAEDDESSFATALYAVLEPCSGVLGWSSCGHLPPLLWQGGEARYAEHVAHPPLGWQAEHDPPEHSLALVEGDVVVLVTDGVVERRGDGLTAGLDELRQVVARDGVLPAAGIAERIIEVMCQSPEDDCCVVVLKRCASPTDPPAAARSPHRRAGQR